MNDKRKFHMTILSSHSVICTKLMGKVKKKGKNTKCVIEVHKRREKKNGVGSSRKGNFRHILLDMNIMIMMPEGESSKNRDIMIIVHSM